MRAGLNPRVTSRIKSILSGDVIFKIYPAALGSSAAELNAAAAGTFKRTLEIRLEDSQGRLLSMLDGFDIDVTAAEACTDPQIGVPSLDDATPQVRNGIATVVVTYDTDAGVTKTYAAGDRITITASDRVGTVLADAYGVADVSCVDTIVS